MEKINIPDFPEIKDKLANRESSPMKTPSTICSSKQKRILKKRKKREK
jgi:hypothetical protein